jgi:hypothetical protein
MKKSSRPESISGGFSAIPHVVLDSQSFKGASDKAKSLLLPLIRQHNGSNNGHLHLAKKWLYKQGWTCDENNRKATHELIERGLIIQTKWGGLNLGPNLFALTWHDISNYVGLDIRSGGYQRGAFALCDLPPTKRRKPPAQKQSGRHDDRDSSDSVIEPADGLASSITESIKPVFDSATGPTIVNNVFIPIPHVKSVKRIVGVKGKSGMAKMKSSQTANGVPAAGLVH